MNETTHQRKKIAHRATYRSIKEADLLLAPLAKALPTLPENLLGTAEALINERDDVLLAYSRTHWPEAYEALWKAVNTQSASQTAPKPQKTR